MLMLWPPRAASTCRGAASVDGSTAAKARYRPTALSCNTKTRRIEKSDSLRPTEMILRRATKQEDRGEISRRLARLRGELVRLLPPPLLPLRSLLVHRHRAILRTLR